MATNRQAEPQRAAAPPRHKLALLTWAGAYALITAILAGLGPLMATWPLPLKTLLISVLMVVALTWLVIPSLTRLFRGWLASAPNVRSRSGSVSPRSGRVRGRYRAIDPPVPCEHGAGF